jgi:hypothetical protein
MASTINPNNIDILYPIAGQDNDTQGFRDNFRNIRNNLARAATEITDLQDDISNAPVIKYNNGNISIPSSPTAPGTLGEIAFDQNHLYVCFSNGTGLVPDRWARANIAAWPESGNTVTNGNTITTGGRIDDSFFIAQVANGQHLRSNVNYRRFVANVSSRANIANLWIGLPTGAENGREIQITSLANVASCFVHQGGEPVIHISNTHFATGGITGVTASFTYSSVVGKWMKF